MKENVYQSKEWQEATEKNGKKIFVIKIEENDEIKAQVNAIEQEILTPLGKKKILFCEGTPIFENKEHGLQILNKFKEESKRYFYGLIRPSVLNQESVLFSNAEYKKVSDSTILIDLQKTEDELWQNLEKKSARWGVKTAEKNNLQFADIKNNEELQYFYNIYLKTAKDGGFKARSYDFLLCLHNSKIAKFFCIKSKNKIIAGAAILLDNEYNILSLTSATEEGYKMQAMPFLYWNLILYSKKSGKKYFDLGGYDKNAKPGDKIYNINKFKENFNGEIVEQTHFATNWKYPFIRKLMTKMRFIKRLYTKN